MQTNINGTRYKKIYIRKKPTDDYVLYKKAYIDGVQTYSAGNPVTYYVDSGTVYTEEVDYDASCLSPTTFTPTKSGWTFVGWREDTTASGSVLSSKVMGDDPVTLYAVFKQTVTCTFKANSTQTVNGTRYYNCGNIANASVTVPTGGTYSGWTWRGWAAAGVTTANASVAYANDATISGLTTNATYYGLYQRTITLSYNGNSNTGGSTASQTGTQYYNDSNIYLHPTFTLRSNGFTRTNYTFSKWAQGSTSGTQYAAGATVTLTANTTFYAVWTLVPYSLIRSGWSTSYAYQNEYTGYTPTMSASATTSAVTFTLTGVVNDGGRAKVYYTSPSVNLTDFSTLTVAGTSKHVCVELDDGTPWYDIYDGVNDSCTECRVELLNSSGTVVATLFKHTNSNGTQSISASYNCKSLSGNYRLRMSLYCIANGGETNNAGSYMTLTKALLS